MTNVLGIKILMTPWVILPLLVLATVISAYLISAAALWILRKMARESSSDLVQRLYRLLESYLFPSLVIGSLLFFLDTVPLPPQGDARR